MQLARNQGILDETSSPSFCSGRKLDEVEQALLWTLLQEDPACPSRVLLEQAARRQFVVVVSLRQVNRWRASRGLNRSKGRPRRTHGSQPVASGKEIIRVAPHVSFVGVHLFARWLDHQDAFAPVVAQLMQAIEAHKQTHPDDDFALLHHRQSTILRRFQALFDAPLSGIDRLSEFDTREHAL